MSYGRSSYRHDAAAGEPRSPHRVIRASAGSGKTYQLSLQYLNLLRKGFEPDTILATTFTRKAAGEILQRVMTRLAAAAIDDLSAAQLSQDLTTAKLMGRHELPVTRRLAMEMLSRLIAKLDRLAICTIDSFFFRMAAALGHELDSPPDATLVDDNGPIAASLRYRAIDAVLGEAGRDSHTLQTMIDLLRRVDNDQPASSVYDSILKVVSTLYEVYRQAPDAQVWSTLQQPGGELNWPQLADAVGVVNEMAPKLPLTKKGQPNQTWLKAWSRCRDLAIRHDWRSFIGDNFIAGLNSAETTTFGTAEIPETWRTAFQPLIQHVTAVLIKQNIGQTSATHELLQRFDEQYGTLRRQAGVMLYSDPIQKLARDLPGLGQDVATLLYYRLDTRVTHLLLDEFQDTSLDQWAVLRPFAQEIAAHGDGGRTFFCVGDVKQAIYGWRGGCAELFDQVVDELHLGPDSLKDLDVSYRSSPVVLDAVNRVFGGLAENRALADHQTAAEAWAAHFHLHRAADPTLPGHALLRTTPATTQNQPGSDADDPESDLDPDDESATPTEADESIARDIARLAQQAPGRSIGVLVGTNKKARAFVGLLRGLGLEVSGEGANTVVDDPAVCLVMSAMTLADHPDDEPAALHVAQSTLARPLALDGWRPGRIDAAHRASLKIRLQLLTHGYAAVLSQWAHHLNAYSKAPSPHLDRLIELADRYDAGPPLRPSDFVRFAESTTIELPHPGPIRVMTVHKAKGLEFDAVVLADLNRKLLGSMSRELIYVLRDSPTGPIRAVHRAANKDIRRLSPQLTQAYAQMVDRRLRDDLCALYVAMTRARHGLYLWVDPPKEKKTAKPSGGATTALSFAEILRVALGGGDLEEDASGDVILYESGDPRWAGQSPLDEKRSSVVVSAPEKIVLTPSSRPRRSWPSVHPSSKPGSRTSRRPGTLSTYTTVEASRLRGVLIHAWLEKIDWLDDDEKSTPGDDTLRAIAPGIATSGSGPGAETDRVEGLIEEFKQMLKHPAVRSNLRRPNVAQHQRVELWKEKRFALRSEQGLVSGTFDRVVIVWSGNRAHNAQLLDFKTDDVTRDTLPEATERYRPQLETYRAALAKLLDIAPTQIDAGLLFVTAGLHVGI